MQPNKFQNKLTYAFILAALAINMVAGYSVLAVTSGNTSAATYPAASTSNAATSSPIATRPILSSQERKSIEQKVETLDDKIDAKQEDLETLEQKAQNYQRMIDLKKQQQTTLQNQLNMMDVQIENIDNSILITKSDIAKNNEEIDKLQADVNKRQKEMDKVKYELGEMIRVYHALDKELQLQMLASKGDISSILNSSEYIDQASQKFRQVLSEIADKKTQLEDAQKVFDGKNDELKAKKMTLEEKMSYLSNEKTSKDILLKETKGEEAKYQELLSRVEEQKQELIGDIDALSEDKRGELAKIKSEAPSPSSGTASTSWYYSQKDPTWGSNRIGLSSTLMKDYGCAVTSLPWMTT